MYRSPRRSELRRYGTPSLRSRNIFPFCVPGGIFTFTFFEFSSVDTKISAPRAAWETEIGITMSKSGLARQDAETIVDVVRELRNVGVNNHRPTIRASITIARMLAHFDGHATIDDPYFQSISRDVLNIDTAKVRRSGESLMVNKVNEAIEKICRTQI